MSYDVWIEIETGAGHYLISDSVNYTYNCGPMFRKALSESTDVGPDGFGMLDLEGKSCRDMLPILKKAVRHMVENKEWHELQNPKNGFGDYKGALRFLAWICQNAMHHPNATIRVC